MLSNIIVSSVKQNLSNNKQKQIEFQEEPHVVSNYTPENNEQYFLSQKPDLEIEKNNISKTKKQKIPKQLEEPTRFLPDTTYSKFYGKPIYHPGYGRCHTKTNLPSEYMQTYNINPQSGKNQPEYVQTFQTAINQAKNRPQTSRPKQIIVQQEPQQPKLKKDSGILPRKTEEVFNEIKETKLRQSMNVSKKEKKKPAVPKTCMKSKKQSAINKQMQGEPKAIIYSQKPEDEDAKLIKQFQQIQEEKLRLQEQDRQLKETLQKQIEEQKEKEQELVSAEKEKYRLLKALKSKKLSVAKKVNEPKHFNSIEEKLNFEQQKITQLSQLGRSINLSSSNLNQGLSEIEMNPKFYRCMNRQYLDKIPAAGKKISRGDSILNNSDFELKILKSNA